MDVYLKTTNFPSGWHPLTYKHMFKRFFYKEFPHDRDFLMGNSGCKLHGIYFCSVQLIER